MILTDREIKIHLERELIVIDPAPAGSAFSSTSVDLTLDRTISIFKPVHPGIETAVDPSSANFVGKQCCGR